jgi:GNAT superfamily N-acetyltransferase
MYSVHQDYANIEPALQKIAAAGYTAIETLNFGGVPQCFGLEPAAFKALCDKYGLKIVKCQSAKDINKYGQAIFDLMNEAYSPLYGYSALSPKQIQQYIKMFLPLLDLRMVTLVTDAEDRIVAVGISMPSLSEALQKAKGRLLPFGWWHLMKLIFMKNYPKVLDLLLVAVKPEYQNKGVNALLLYDLIPIFQQMGFEYAESNPELEMNGKVQAQWEYFKTEQHKRRRAYKKEI